MLAMQLGKMPAEYAFTAADAGTHTFSATLIDAAQPDDHRGGQGESEHVRDQPADRGGRRVGREPWWGARAMKANRCLCRKLISVLAC